MEIQRRAGIGRGRGGMARASVAPPQPETREMQAQSIEQITQGLQNATVGGRYRRSRQNGPTNPYQEEGSTDSGQFSGPPSSDPPSPEHQSLAQRVRAEAKTKEQKRLDDDLFDQRAHLQPAMMQKIDEGKFYGTSGTEVVLSSNFYRVRNIFFCLLRCYLGGHAEYDARRVWPRCILVPVSSGLQTGCGRCDEKTRTYRSHCSAEC